MPVWHEFTRSLREEDDLVVVGIASEQHADRARLFAQWHGIDWPILWDPFNLTGSSAVPNITGIDEHGVVRVVRPKPDEFVEAFISPAFRPPADPTPRPWILTPTALAEPGREGALDALAWFLGAPWTTEMEPAALEAGMERRLAALAAAAGAPGADPAWSFRLGVARRLRLDSPVGRAGDFGSAVEAWSAALRSGPHQYVWRRRLQQFGPRLDKPYNFYGWIEGARAELRERGEEPVAVSTRLCGSECSEHGPLSFSEGGTEPDPEGAIERAVAGLVDVDAAVVFHSRAVEGRLDLPSDVRVHVTLRPGRGVHWTNDAGPALVWIDPPEGWRAERRLFTLPAPASETSAELRAIDFEMSPKPGVLLGEELSGYALLFVCGPDDGPCRFVRCGFSARTR
ncbi:MAG: hypothetical protein VYE81_06960 [Planctomycetota bacterium]|nr:hypothetical protein [Planctomycetota bacterium]